MSVSKFLNLYNGQLFLCYFHLLSLQVIIYPWILNF